ncbi:MAG: DUF938 domain-containing protein [Thiohalocapsa sp. PB-PSB1]|jgi:cyclopropane fatty-acyl-phospholipid synthase-like methyltransferase|nr:MAG: DUF938 domain-containing protein [Thiohalocapsa sp. PB-PSB1]HCS90928.1 methylase [Chromatiaceae bacterium]
MISIDKPYSEACEQNKAPILAIIAPLFARSQHVLEIGSGTGQHAVHFAAAMPHLRWQCSDVAAQLPGIRLWLDEAALANLPQPLHLDIDGDSEVDRNDCWPDGQFDAVFSANTAHILSLIQVERMFRGVGRLLPVGAPFALYGPFSENGRHISRSNAEFDRMLRQRDPFSGVRDLEDIRRFADSAGLELEQNLAMPVNNRTLIWRKCR